MSGSQNQPLRIIGFNDYPIMDGAFGGAQRVKSLYNAFGKQNTVILFTFGSETDVSEHRNFTEITLPNSKGLVQRAQKMNKSWASVMDVLAIETIAVDQTKRLLRSFISPSDLLIVEQPYLCDLVSDFSNFKIYNSQNLELNVKRPVIEKHYEKEAATNLLNRIAKLECSAGLNCDQIFAVSEIEKETFETVFGPKVQLVPNGFDELFASNQNLKKRKSKKLQAIFVGSAHPPNTDGLQKFINEILPDLPSNFMLTVVGNVCETVRATDPRIRLMGKLSDNQLIAEIKKSDFSINPVQSGAGSSLKVIQSLSLGVPVVSTSFGSRGFGKIEGIFCYDKNIVGEFVKASRKATKLNASSRKQIATKANGFSWQNIATNALQDLAHNPHFAEKTAPLNFSHTKRKKLCFITYRSLEKVTGGGENYLTELLAKLPREITTTLVTVDAEEIENSGAYGSRISEVSDVKTTLWPRPNTLRFACDEPPTDDEIFETELHLAKEYFRLSYDGLGPLGAAGVSFPTVVNNDAVETTGFWLKKGSSFSLFLPENSNTLLNFSNINELRYLEILDENLTSLGQVEISDDKPYHVFSTKKRRHVVMRFKDIKSPGTPATHFLSFFAVKDQQATPLEAKQYRSVFTADKAFDTVLKRSSSHLSLRWPQSTDLVNWLESNAHGFDHFILHGCTFKLQLDVSRLLRRLKVGYQTIPHFHETDPFYFDPGILEILKGADVNHVVSEKQDDLLKSLNINRQKLIPGGGINHEPLQVLNKKEKDKFLDRFELTETFVLFVGRNDPTKQLGKIIRIFEDHLPKEIMLAIVSPDNVEGEEMPPNVRVLGRLSKEDLKTAYKACMCHINLGKSESFGLTIVEAMMWGKKTIAWADTPAFQDLIIEGFNGSLSTDDREIATHILAISQSPTDEKLLVKLNEASMKFDYSNLATEFIENAGLSLN